MRKLAFVSGIAFPLLAAACDPDLVERPYLIEQPRLIGVRAIPAEPRPREPVRFEALIAGPGGTIATDALSWSFCLERKPVAELGPVAPGCIAGVPAESFAPIGAGKAPSARLPSDACRLFGPDNPPPKPGEPPSRPVDPDPTGGYYQPVRVVVGTSPELASVRVRCGLAGATPEQTREYETNSQPNTNPVIESVVMDVGQGGVRLVSHEADPNAVTEVPAGAQVLLVVRWPECPAGAMGCGGAEPYVYLDLEKRALVSRRESLRVSWFTTAGAFVQSRSGRSEAEAAVNDARNVLTVPPTPGAAVWVWAVLRDDRGGATWASFRFVVK